ncbi:MAG: LysR family transcriptional regulator [Paracoccaceae bacterium]
MLNWNDLKFILETVRQNGTSGAARALGVSHATVARRIFAAEKVLGTRLFDRLPGGYRPTEAGADAARAAEQMEQTEAALSRSVGARDQSISGKLVVTAPLSLIDRFLTSVFTDFRAEYPQVDLTVLGGTDPLNLARREADIAIRVSNNPAATLFGSKVARQKAGVYASAKFVANDSGGPLDWIRFAQWPGPPEQVRKARPVLNPILTVDDMVAAVAAVRSGLGATRMPCFLGETDPLLARVRGIELFDYPDIWVLTHSDLRKTPRIRAFMRFASDRLRNLQPIFEGTVAGPTT